MRRRCASPGVPRAGRGTFRARDRLAREGRPCGSSASAADLLSTIVSAFGSSPSPNLVRAGRAFACRKFFPETTQTGAVSPLSLLVGGGGGTRVSREPSGTRYGDAATAGGPRRRRGAGGVRRLASSPGESTAGCVRVAP